MTDTPRIVCISQARMLSTRLPGKVLRPLDGRPLLQYQLERLQRMTRADAVAVATVDSPECDPIVDLCEEFGVPVVRGDEQDVLSRFVKCGNALEADIVVRVTSDCPLIDPALVDRVIGDYLDGDWDFCALDIPESYPRGLDCEVFSMDLLNQVDRDATKQYEREHVMPHVHGNRERFKCHWRTGGRGGQYRFCVDTPEDFALVTRIAEALSGNTDFGWEAVVDTLDANPDWTTLNAHVRQKTE